MSMTVIEREFLESIEAVKNEKGSYVYVSQDGHEHILLDFILMEYKLYLINNGILSNK